MIAGTTKTLGNHLTRHPPPLSHDPGRHSLSALFALIRGSLKFSCTSGWKKRQEQAAYGSCTLATLQQGNTARTSLCAVFLGPYLLFQTTALLAVNPLPQVRRSKDSLDPTPTPKIALCFSTSKTFVLTTCPHGKSSTLLSMQPTQIHFFFIQTQEQVGPGPALSHALSQSTRPASISSYLGLPHLEVTVISSLLFSLWVIVIWHPAHLSIL